MATEEVLPTFGSLLDVDISLKIKTQWQQAIYISCIALHIITLLLFIITVPFGVVSWILIPKWRKFSNFLFMNLSVAGIINMIGYHLCSHHHYHVIAVVLLVLVPRTIMTHWVLVAAAMFYSEIVIVYDVKISRKYLKASIFTWIVPIVEILTVYAIDNYFKIRIVVNFHYGINLLIFSVIIIVYLVTLHSLVKAIVTQKRTSKRQKIVISLGLSIVPSGISSLLPVLLMEMLHSNLVLYYIAIFVCLLTLTTGLLGFLSLKQHRVLWAEYKRKRSMIVNV